MNRSSKQIKRTKIQEQLAAALDVSIERNRPTLGYRLGITITVLAMLLLPLLYLGLIALIVHTIWWLIVRAQTLEGGIMFWCFVGAGLVSIILFFLLKPLGSLFSGRKKQIRLKREAEPFLFEYVEAICRAVNAPAPKSIRLDCEANASASFRKGIWNLFQKDLTLTIGMPLIVGLNIRQLTGVLAHEFGHFSQGYGMRLNTVTTMINYWFLRAAYERDLWDYRLIQASENVDLRIGIFIYAARFFLWLMRRLLAFLAIIGQAICCFMTRQMEYDADRFETRLVGAKTFEQTCKRLTSIALARQMATHDLSAFYNEGRLADNFAQLTVSNIPFIPKEFYKHVRKYERDQKTAWYDTHPTNRDRITAAKKESSEGILQLPPELNNFSASNLFHDFEKLSKRVTIQFYEEQLGKEFNKKTVKNTTQLIQKRDAEFESGKALDRYFQAHIPILRPLRLSNDVMTPPENPVEIVSQLKDLRTPMIKMADKYEKYTECLDEAQNSWIMASEAFLLLNANLRFKAKDYRLTSTRKKAVKERLKQTDQCIRNLELQMMSFEDMGEDRLSLGIQLLQLPKIHQNIPEGDLLWIEIKRLIPHSRFVSRMMTKLKDLNLANRKLTTLLPRLDNKQRPELYQAIEIQMREIHNTLTDVYTKMESKPYPFDHEDATLTIQSYALPEVPDPQDILGLISASQYVCERLAGIQVRLYSKLAHAAEKVEAAVGLPPLKKREKKEKQN